MRVCVAKKDKGGEITTKSFMPTEPCPTAADAKLRAAVFTLHAINSHLSMTMAFPPSLRCGCGCGWVRLSVVDYPRSIITYLLSAEIALKQNSCAARLLWFPTPRAGSLSAVCHRGQCKSLLLTSSYQFLFEDRDYWQELNQTHKDEHKLPVPGDPFETKAPNTTEFKKKMEAIGREAPPEPAPPPPKPRLELSKTVSSRPERSNGDLPAALWSDSPVVHVI